MILVTFVGSRASSLVRTAGLSDLSAAGGHHSVHAHPTNTCPQGQCSAHLHLVPRLFSDVNVMSSRVRAVALKHVKFIIIYFIIVIIIRALQSIYPACALHLHDIIDIVVVAVITILLYIYNIFQKVIFCRNASDWSEQ